MSGAHSRLFLSVVVPAFDEASRLLATIEGTSKYLARQSYTSEILVVDDGSSDATSQVARDQAGGPIPIRLVQHPDGRNHGKGATVRRGILAASGAYRLFMDSDNSTTIDQFEGFLPLFEQNYDVVVGSRRVTGARIQVSQTLTRVVAGWLGNLLVRVVVLPGIADTQAGFKAYTARCSEVVFPRLSIDRWAFDIETLVIARHHGFRVWESPIVWVNSPDSKVRAVDYLWFLRDVWRIRRNLRAGSYD